MSGRGYQRNVMGACEEMEMEMEVVVCPKPRRFGLSDPSITEPITPFRYPASHQTMMGDAGAGSELLDIILSKGVCVYERTPFQVASPPPFFSGSPPVRAHNPVTQDAQFGTETVLPFSPALSSPSFSARKGNVPARMKFTPKPAAVRIEGFDCGSCSISARA
ncbi:hypothetical protein SAY86_005529 [Trapa natans]|uniref:Uncharacterized protein n=1 Tax=Trapa natans TaxID=22666 RepID=A0AAN7L911_TRANT|nr:hypothetical protein SAY86_005529 [Trapa natans]